MLKDQSPTPDTLATSVVLGSLPLKAVADKKQLKTHTVERKPTRAPALRCLRKAIWRPKMGKMDPPVLEVGAKPEGHMCIQYVYMNNMMYIYI